MALMVPIGDDADDAGDHHEENGDACDGHDDDKEHDYDGDTPYHAGGECEDR